MLIKGVRTVIPNPNSSLVLLFCSELTLRYRFLWVFVALLVAPVCQRKGPEPTTDAHAAKSLALTDSMLIGEYSAATLASRVWGVPLVSSLARYSVKVYNLNYRICTPENTEIMASGAVPVPVVAEALPVLSYQHCTLEPRSER